MTIIKSMSHIVRGVAVVDALDGGEGQLGHVINDLESMIHLFV